MGNPFCYCIDGWERLIRLWWGMNRISTRYQPSTMLMWGRNYWPSSLKIGTETNNFEYSCCWVWHQSLIVDVWIYKVVPQFVNAKLVNITPITICFIGDKSIITSKHGSHQYIPSGVNKHGWLGHPYGKWRFNGNMIHKWIPMTKDGKWSMTNGR